MRYILKVKSGCKILRDNNKKNSNYEVIEPSNKVTYHNSYLDAYNYIESVYPYIPPVPVPAWPLSFAMPNDTPPASIQ